MTGLMGGWSDGECRRQEQDLQIARRAMSDAGNLGRRVAEQVNRVARVLAARRERAAQVHLERAEAMERLAWEAYHAGREALVGHPEVRLCVRDHEPGQSVVLIAERPVVRRHFRDGAEVSFGAAWKPGATSSSMAIIDDYPLLLWTVVALGNLHEPDVIRHQARALAKALVGERPTGAEDLAVGRGAVVRA